MDPKLFLVVILTIFFSEAARRFPMPSILLKNAAIPGTRYPMLGLGTRGPGYKLGLKQECWYYPKCCTKDYCPVINATRDWLKLGGWRLDTGYPFGDTAPNQKAEKGPTCGGGPPHQGKLGGHWCEPHGIKKGIEESGLKREEIFITIKFGSGGPMQEPDKGDRQGINMNYWLGTNYSDLAMMHEGDLGTSGHKPSEFCKYPTTPECRRRVFQGCIDWMHKGGTRACGVANWELEWLQELKNENVTLPAVVQIKYHVHQSTASPRIKAIKDFCDENDIVFNGYSPLGRPDATTFLSPMTETILEESLVKDIAKKHSRSPAQVLIRWVIQQGIPTNPRTMVIDHMKENLNVFNWTLSDDEMTALNSMPQCNVTRGNAFMKNDTEYAGHGNMIGPSLHC